MESSIQKKSITKSLGQKNNYTIILARNLKKAILQDLTMAVTLIEDSKYGEGDMSFLNIYKKDINGIEEDRYGKFYVKNGEYHREDGPAIKWGSGRKDWYFNGKHHRTDGPAIEYPDGRNEWWLNGKKYSKESHCEAANSFKYNRRGYR